jgi:uncharacterized MAPEG superfamily protein
MTIAFWCILAAAMLPYLTIAIGKYDRKYDNRSPRDWEAQLEGKQRRAVFAHHNHFEAFAPFAAAVIVAHLAAAPQAWSNALAAAFIGLRLAYTWAYVADHHIARSLLWAGGMACVVALFIAGATAR